MFTMSMLVRVFIWVLDFHKLEALGVLRGSPGFALQIVAKLLCFVFIYLIQSLSYMPWTKKKFNNSLIGSESGLFRQ